MKTIYLVLTVAFAAILGQAGFAQDKIIRRTNDTIPCKIKEIGSDEIKYQLPGYPPDLLFTLDKEKITKIVFENGQEMTFKVEIDNPENYINQRKNAMKIDYISPLTGNTTLSLEHSLKPGQSIEGSVGFIGLGIDPNDINPSGGFVKFGMKFIKSPDFYLRGIRYAHILKGTYFKPEIGLGVYSRDHTEVIYDYYNYYEKEERIDIFTGFINVVIGKQWVINDLFLIDFYGGAGYGFDTNDKENGGYHYGWAIVDDNVPLTFSTGIKIGFLFK